MTSPEDRFRIPGGSLDLDFDDDHENGTGQVDQSSISSAPELPPPIQSIVHLTPTDLSRVLSWIPHPLAARTAEYVLALNISGNAFRNLDLSSLRVLANHDPAMAEQLARIQEGVLPSPPPPAARSQNSTLRNNDGALLRSREDCASLSGDPPAASHLTSSGSAKPLPCADRPSTPPSSSTSPCAVPPAPETFTPPSNEEEAGNAEDPPVPATSDEFHTDDSAEGRDTTSGTPQNAEDSGTTPPPRSDTESGGQGDQRAFTSARDAQGALPDGASAVKGVSEESLPTALSAEQAREAGEEQAVDFQSSAASKEASSLPGATTSEMQTLGRSSAPSPSSLTAASAPPLPSGDASADVTSSEVQESDLAGEGSSEDSTSPTGATKDSVDVDVDGDQAQDMSGSGCATAATSEACTSSNSPAKYLKATSSLAALADEGMLSVKAHGGSSETHALPRDQGGAARDPGDGGGVPHGPAASILASRHEGASPTTSEESSADSCTRKSDSAPVSMEVSSNPSTVSLAWTTSPHPGTLASCASTSSSVLQTPPASSISPPDPMNDTSFLDLDLLQFSPFSVRAQLSHDHDAQMSAAELFKENACLVLGAELLMTGGPCEEQFEHASDESSESVQQQDPSLDLLAHGSTPTPSSSTAEFHGAAAALGDQGTTLSLDKDSYLGDEPPASNNEGSFATEFGLNRPTGSRPDSYFCLGKTVVEDSCGACDDDILAQVAVIRPHACSSINCDANAKKHLHAGTAEPYVLDSSNKDSNTKVVGATHCPPNGRELRPQLLQLSIPISPTSLEEELSQLSPLFSPIARNIARTYSENTACPAFERLFSERSSSVSRAPAKRPVKLKRRERMQTVAHESRGTDTSDSGFTSRETTVFVDASVQTDPNVAEENLQRRVKVLERELRSLRGVRRSDERGRESKPRSFWKKMASTDRVVPPPEPMGFGLLNFSSFGQENFGTSTGS